MRDRRSFLIEAKQADPAFELSYYKKGQAYLKTLLRHREESKVLILGGGGGGGGDLARSPEHSNNHEWLHVGAMDETLGIDKL